MATEKNHHLTLWLAGDDGANTDSSAPLHLIAAQMKWKSGQTNDGQRGQESWKAQTKQGVPECLAILLVCYRLWGVTYPAGTGFRLQDPANSSLKAAKKLNTLLANARRSATLGWHTAIFGKAHIGNLISGSSDGAINLVVKDLPPENVTIHVGTEEVTAIGDPSKLQQVLCEVLERLGGKSYATSYAAAPPKNKIPADLPRELAADLPTVPRGGYLDRYCQIWRDIMANPKRLGLWRIDQLRLDRYVWPRLSWERPAGRGDTDATRRVEIPGQGEEPTRRMLVELLAKRRVVLYDDAGMGKTAFTFKCVEFLLSESHWNEFQGLPPLVVRLEGRWPRKKPTSSAEGVPTLPLPPPLSVRGMLVAEVIRSLTFSLDAERASNGAAELESAVGKEVDAALVGRRVVVLIDAFDQMIPEDREQVVQLLAQDPLGAGADHAASQCAWFLTGRAYAIKPFEKRLGPQTLRLRLERFSEPQQDLYFGDVAVLPVFHRRQTKPLDWICQPRKNLANDLGLPLNLREIRTLIDDCLEGASGSDETLSDLPNDRRIATSGELHALVSRVLLERALGHIDERRDRDREGRGRSLPAPPEAGEPPTSPGKLQVLMHVCGLLALQMMLEENYNASVDSRMRLPGTPPGQDGVQAFLDRARVRYLAATAPVHSPKGSSSMDQAVQPSDRWDWAVRVLQQIEVTHRGDIDSFNRECRSFRDRKTMEWYAAHYLMNDATHSDLYERISGAGDRCVFDFAADGEWQSNCWRQAIDMPADLVRDDIACQTLGVLFERPSDDRPKQTRPCELMWLAWERWLKPTATAPYESPSGVRRRLVGAAEITAKFRGEFRLLCDQANPLALSLRFDKPRDRPDKKLGNKTALGQYRLIPPDGSSTTFRGERPAQTKVSAFWLRKFVVTNEEYRLFDSHYQSGCRAEFDELDRPVVGVDWFSAAMFCRWLGADYRLPSEAQWEAACRANDKGKNESEYWFGDNEAQLTKHAWFGEIFDQRTHSLAESERAGSHENPWGLYDMHGNVLEWCQDWHAEYKPMIETPTDQQGPSTGSYRVLRGGCWYDSARLCRSAYRRRGTPSSRRDDLGFRVALVQSVGAELRQEFPPEAGETGGRKA